MTNSLDDLSSNYVKKSGDNIDSLLIDSNLSVGGQIINENISTDNAGNVTIQGKYSTKKHGSLNLNFEDGIKAIKINDKTLNDTLQELSSTTINSLNYESNHSNKQFIFKVSQTNGTISSEAKVLEENDIPNLHQEKIINLIDDLKNISSEYLLTSNFKTSTIDNDKGFVTGEQLSAIYHTVDGKSIIEISLNGYKQEINCADFIKDGMITEVKVDPKEKTLIITWNTDKDESGSNDITVIPLRDLANIYKNGRGIEKLDDLTIQIDDSIVVTHDEFDDTNKYVSELNSNIIPKLTYDVKDSLARLKHTVKFDGIIEHYEGVTTIKELFDSNTDYNGLKGSVRNNSLYKVNISENNKYNISSVFDVEGLSFTNSDYLFINEKTDENQIPTNDLKSSSIYVIKTGVSKIDFDIEIFDRILNDTDLSNWIIKEEKVRLSNDTDLSNWCDNLSVKLDNEISNRISNDTDLSNWCDNLSVKLDNEISNRISNDTDLSNWIKDEEGVRYDNDLILSNQVDFLSSTLSTEIKDRYDNDLILSNQVDFLSSTLSTEIKDRYDNDLILSNQVEFLSDVLSTEIKDRYDNDLILSNEINYLSSLIDTKTSISSDDGLMLGLTIKRISEKDYHDLVIDGPIDNSTLYIVSSDIRDVYGERIINLQDPIELSDAVNKKYVDEKVGVLKDNIVDIFNSDSELSILLTDDSLSDFSIENIKKSLRLILTTLSK